MPVVTLNLRDLKSGERMLAEFTTLDACVEWLRDRPQFVDVLGPTDEHLSREVDQMLREALRPLDDEEQQLIVEGNRRRLQELTAADAQRRADAEEDAAQAMASLGPDDIMRVVWERGQGVTNAEPLDERSVPAVVVEAVTEWVAERDSWVSGRGERLRAASLTVWPGEVPARSERVQPGGQFETEPLG